MAEVITGEVQLGNGLGAAVFKRELLNRPRRSASFKTECQQSGTIEVPASYRQLLYVAQVSGTPPSVSIFLSLPSDTNSKKRLSGDQTAVSLPSVPGS
jgi:hypothetical protein